MDGSVSSPNIPDKSEFRSNRNKGLLHCPRAQELMTGHQIKFPVKPSAPILVKEFPLLVQWIELVHSKSCRKSEKTQMTNENR